MAARADAGGAGLRRSLAWLGLAGLCAAYVQGPVAKLADFAGAQAEMAQFGLAPAPLVAAGVIAFELGACACVLGGRLRRPAAAALCLFTLAATLLALRWWALPAGHDRAMAANAFFEHLGLAGAWLWVALGALDGPLGGARARRTGDVRASAGP
ncbi:DoxX family protein [Albimonas sp. CAU 1670]|uniref:DoxX family protein n=1 Tax=Albimonas sp. CAU 1670 TaxID=3032599 RepID=UPI0023DCE494|nr:DoxX family protein [Albimonas sp. CAU 1670]MDF2234102.1 DoxX family protein [Albimonas sp. CAU 1670]